MIMWVMSDRAIPRSYRMMEGFGVHTFRLVNARRAVALVKFHWKPLLGVHSLVWDEAQKIAGKDPDFHRRDLWEAIERGDYPRVRVRRPGHRGGGRVRVPFDVLDPTKIWPEELVPVQRIGKLTLNRNPDNFFAETEQVAFHPGTSCRASTSPNDPLLQGRLFSYLDTQLIRLGGPNFPEIPINRPVAPVHNNQRDGFMRQTINTEPRQLPAQLARRWLPVPGGRGPGGFVSVPRARRRAEGARAQPELQRPLQPGHAVLEQPVRPGAGAHRRALRFELGKVQEMAIRQRMVDLLTRWTTAWRRRWRGHRRGAARR